MEELWQQAISYLTVDKLFVMLRAAFLLAVGLLVARVLARAAWHLTNARLAPQQAVLLRRVVFYLVLALFFVAILHEFGFNLGVLLGAAGIVSMAIGFASQTSVSNLVSGLFLIAEEPFGIGDSIKVGDTSGEVLSIDLMSVKLRTYDNLYVRIPNETLIKSEVRTLTKFPVRRLDLAIDVAYREDLERVRTVLMNVADKDPLCLEEPAPLFLFQGFGDSGIKIQFSPWATRENYILLKNSIPIEIKRRFDAEGIEIPFPHLSIYAGSESAPIDLRVVPTLPTGDEESDPKDP